MQSFESNLAFARACTAELQDYERADALFWPLSARPAAGASPFLQMTLGNIVLALDELHAVEAGLSPMDRAALRRVQAEWETRWAARSARLEAKARHEIASRIAQWRAYVAEAKETGDLADYPAAVRPRLCAARLLEWLGTGAQGARESSGEMEAIDALLDAELEQGPCILGAELAAIYPPVPPYRFLYRRPRRSGDGS
jgi:hypothetical protein